jgi:acyl transferase domain-containing protein
VEGGWTPPVEAPSRPSSNAPERLVIDFGDHGELLDKLAKARKAAWLRQPAGLEGAQAQGIFRGSGRKPGQNRLLFPGQGSQYVNMGANWPNCGAHRRRDLPEADAVMTPILGGR